MSYQHTDDRTGEAIVECDGCGHLWPADDIRSGWCPDCRGVDDLPDCPHCGNVEVLSDESGAFWHCPTDWKGCGGTFKRCEP